MQRVVDTFTAIATPDTNVSTLMIEPRHGKIEGRRGDWILPAAGSLKFYLFGQRSTVITAIVADATMTIVIDDNDTMGGKTATSSDFLAVEEAGGLTFRTISSITSATANVLTLEAGAVVTCAAGAKVFLCMAADVLTLTKGSADTGTDKQNVFSGSHAKPVYVATAATGVHEFSMYCEVLAKA